MIHTIIADPDSATRKALSLLLQRKFGEYKFIEVDTVESLIPHTGGYSSRSASTGLETLRFPHTRGLSLASTRLSSTEDNPPQRGRE